MKLIQVEDRELQTSTFTASPDFTTEDGVLMTLEDGTTSLQFDGTATWTIKVIHVTEKNRVIGVDDEEFISTPVEWTFTLLNEDGEEILNEDSENIISEDNLDWNVRLLIA